MTEIRKAVRVMLKTCKWMLSLNYIPADTLIFHLKADCIYAFSPFSSENTLIWNHIRRNVIGSSQDPHSETGRKHFSS